ncbi:hypothetical protein HX021_08290 [Sphingobacterium sp. N143]|uniref:hypothetical protein n=1 Tax=Sphingobacterium sp. N143 TaxID=2746727 RepID=UPI002576F018|nr:hypothetical protein [Sphingobacterium sp. N143]MDM1294296.1 hypothetical protein [Sphingobacterium sp. N143]
MKIIDNRELFEVEFNSNTMHVLALDLKSAISHVLDEQSNGGEDDFIRGEKLSDNECIKAVTFDEETGKHLNLVDWIKEEINTGDKPIILTYTEV